MRFDFVKVVTSVLLLTAAGCRIEPPNERFGCDVHADCPTGFFCNERAPGVKRCSQQLLDAGAGDDAGTLDAGWDADTQQPDSGSDAGVIAADSGEQAPDTATPVEPDAAMPIEDAGAPGSPVGENELPPLIQRPLPECGREPEAAGAYFVSAGVGEDVANCGGPEGPCRSLHKALQRAVDNGVSFVYLDNTELFIETEPLLLPANVVVVGGFSNVNGRWTRLCDATRGKTRLASSGNPALVAEQVGPSKIAALTVETRAANASETMIGLLARGAETQLWLDAVTIVAADGGDGVAGTTGASGAIVNASCVPSDGADGESVGGSGIDAPTGSFGPDGYTVSNGTPGADGAFGHAGTLGPPPACADCGDPCCGGAISSCGNPGGPGCGGAAGGGGGGGSGGGSSLALYVWDAHVSVSGGSLRAGTGGDGGPGGAAGSGSAGAAGAVGAAGPSCTTCYIDFGGDSAFCYWGAPLQGQGTQGGAGGSGRDGGPGGAGAGGYAYAAFRGGAAKLMIADDTTLEHGAPGVSAAAGAPGQAAPLGP